jgi:hypothetical protein
VAQRVTKAGLRILLEDRRKRKENLAALFRLKEHARYTGVDWDFPNNFNPEEPTEVSAAYRQLEAAIRKSKKEEARFQRELQETYRRMREEERAKSLRQNKEAIIRRGKIAEILKAAKSLRKQPGYEWRPTRTVANKRIRKLCREAEKILHSPNVNSLPALISLLEWAL